MSLSLIVRPHEGRPLKVQFEFSAGDLAEVASRASDRSRVVQGWCQHGIVTRIPPHACGKLVGELALSAQNRPMEVHFGPVESGQRELPLLSSRLKYCSAAILRR